MWVWVEEGRDAVLATLRRATVEKIDDSGSQQILKKMRGLASERPEDIYRAQPHGFTSHPPAGSEGLYLSLGGRSDRIIALGFEHKDKRIKNLPQGGATLYDSEGNVIYAKVGNGIAIDAKKGKVYVKPEPGKFVFLGGDGETGTYEFVMTEGGPSINVKARTG